MALLDYQVEPTEKLHKILLEKGSALDASDAGSGKTYTAVHTALRLGLPTIIICPKSVIPSWERICEAEGLEPVAIINYEKAVRGKTEFILRDGKKFVWNHAGLVIWDEVHKTRSYNSLNSKMLLAAWQTKFIRCLCLSATAFQNPLDMRALGEVLGLHKGYNFWFWAISNGAKKDRWGGFRWAGSQAQLEEIHKQIFPARGVRVRIKDLGNAFPSNKLIAEALEIDKPEELDAIYRDAQEELARLREKTDTDLPSAMTVVLRARQKAELLKVPLLVEFAKELLDEGNSVAIFVNFTATLELLAKHLETDCIIKSQDADERQRNIDRFQKNERHVIICNSQSGGVGISLHDETGQRPRRSLIAPTYSAVDLKQCLGRIYRSGGKSPVVQRIVYAANTVEEKVCLRVRQKIDNIDTINNGDIEDGLTWQLNSELVDTAKKRS